MTVTSRTEIDPRAYRDVLGNYPTGVVAVTAVEADGSPVAMTVGSFTSASLDPPLVAFLPAKSSSTFPKILAAGSFCANVLGSSQEGVCRAFAAKGADKFKGVNWRPAESGAPILDDVVAWMDCDIEQVVDVGDHYLVVGRIRGMEAAGADLPLLFFQGGYGEFASPWKTAGAAADLLPALRVADAARGALLALADELGVECLLSVADDGDMVIVASASRPGHRLVNPIGQRIPLLPPIGIPLIAWRDQTEIDSWVARLDDVGDPSDILAIEELVARVRSRGASIALASPEQLALESAVAHLAGPKLSTVDELHLRQLIGKLVDVGSYEPASLDPAGRYHVRHLSVPLAPNGSGPAMSISLYGLPSSLTGDQIYRHVEAAQHAASQIESRIA